MKKKITTDLLQVRNKDDVTFLNLNRPEKSNALSPSLIKQMFKFFQKKQWLKNTKMIVLSGEGKNFCAGADLKCLSDESVFTKTDLESLFSLLEAIEACPLLVVAHAKGFIFGGGVGLISVADIAFAETNATFCFSEVKLGLVPSIISPFVLKKTGLSKAKPFLLSGQVFSARKAQEMGLVHFTGSKEQADKFLKDLINSFKKVDLRAVSETKSWLCALSSSKPSEKSGLKTKSVHLIHQARKHPEVKKRIKQLLTQSLKKK